MKFTDEVIVGKINELQRAASNFGDSHRFTSQSLFRCLLETYKKMIIIIVLYSKVNEIWQLVIWYIIIELGISRRQYRM